MITIDKKTKFEQVRDNLREMLLSGQWTPGSRFYSENKLTSMLGVARMTVNKALSVLESEGLLERVQGKGTFVAKRVDLLRSERNAARRLPLALVTSYRPEDAKITTYMSLQFINYIDDKAYEANYSVNVFNFQDYDCIPDEAFGELCSNKFSCIIIYHLPGFKDLEHEIKRLKNNTMTPIILGGEMSDQVDCVDYDHKWIGWRGADYLMELGHRELAFLGYHTDFTWMKDRVEGFQAACDAGLNTCHNSKVFYISGNSFFPGAQKELVELFDDIVSSCTALMCANDELAAMFLEVANQRQLVVPDCISIIGADDSGTLRDLNLTTFKLTGEEIACSCLALLEKRIAQSGPWGPEAVLLKPRLLRRHTTGKYDGHKS